MAIGIGIAVAKQYNPKAHHMIVPFSDGNFLNLLPLSKDHADN